MIFYRVCGYSIVVKCDKVTLAHLPAIIEKRERYAPQAEIITRYIIKEEIHYRGAVKLNSEVICAIFILSATFTHQLLWQTWLKISKSQARFG